MIVPVVQGSPAWQAWRLGGVCGTDAGVILAAHRRERGAGKALLALLGQKLAPPPPAKDYPEHFRARGPTEAIARLSQRLGINLQPACVQHPEEPWLRATLGGLTWLGDAVALGTGHNIPEHEQALAGVLPESEVAQVQHALLASGAGLCWYVSTSPAKRFAPGERWAVVEVLEDAELQAELLTAASEFYRRVQIARSGGKWVKESA